jgi:hypothetical protein
MDFLKDNDSALLKAGGTILKGALGFRAADAQRAAGGAIQRAKEVEAGSLFRRAGSERAFSQRLAADERLNTELLISRAQAVAAASGTGGPGIETLQGKIAAEGKYRELSALFEGEDLARGLEDLGRLREFEGELAAETGRRRRTAKQFAAVTTILSEVVDQSFFDKFGEDEDETTLNLA